MPKTTPKSDQVIMLQNQYVREMRKYGVIEVYVMMQQNTQNMNK